MPLCPECGQSFEITERELVFLSEIDVPPPKSCPACRLMRRMVERNARVLYRRTCSATGARILSQYHADQPFPVYSPEAWWSDTWDGLDEGKEIDFSRPFFPQFKELKSRVPHTSRFVIQGTMENSDFVNCAGFLKNCYLCSELDYDEDCYYSTRIYHCRNLVDCMNCFTCELCYECIDCTDCHSLSFSQDCQNCSESFFLNDCIGCTDCIGCINQRQKKHMIMNEQLTKEEFDRRKNTMGLESTAGRAKLRKQYKAFFALQPRKATETERNENCTGDHLYDSKNSFDCFDGKDLEDCMHCAKAAMGVKSSIDYSTWGDKAERMYQCSACGNNAFNMAFCTNSTTNNSNLRYCDSCTGCSDCFGCIGLKKKKFCVLNVQYSKEEYGEMVEKVIAHMRKTGEWGEFFPKDVCPYAFNETTALEFFPLTKEEALKRGYAWREETEEMPDVQKVIPGTKLPDTITDVPDDVLNWAVTSERSGRPFRIVKQELAFYRTHNIPLPYLHPDERHADRLARRPPRRLWKRNCASCGKEMETTFNPKRPERVLCESCYLKEVY